jgi:superfamily II DNA/RNA helicase
MAFKFLSISRRSIVTRNTKHPDVDIQKELTFKAFKLMPEIVSVLNNSLNILTPSPVQQLAIPHLITGKSAMIGGQTGTGKTLAYCLPLIHRLK